MDNFVTGGKGGGGAVFALDATEVSTDVRSLQPYLDIDARPPRQNLIFAGTRKGHVKVFDARASAGGTKPEVCARATID